MSEAPETSPREQALMNALSVAVAEKDSARRRAKRKVNAVILRIEDKLRKRYPDGPLLDAALDALNLVRQDTEAITETED